MPQRSIRVHAPQADTAARQSDVLLARFEAVRHQLGVPDAFAQAVLDEAGAAAAAPQDLPSRDETAVPFVTIDPPGSMDLDQALHLERDADGYRVRYAIADVPAFVAAGGTVDAEARRRGETVYAPDRRTPLHPEVLSEGAASLLPGERRPAFVWDLRLAADGTTTSTTLYRAIVASTARLDYDGVQEAIDAGTAEGALMLLKEVGEKRIALERERGGASLPMPEQEVSEDEHGHYRLHFRPPVPAEDWNAQISLMTGMAAADLMIGAKVGILRTMPEPDQNAVGRFRHASRALGIEWHQDVPYGQFLRSLDRTNPAHLALIHEATALFRGAGYTPFDGAVPDQREHAAVAAPYAHVTAPLRRLVDRFGLVVCEAISTGQPVPGWVLEALPALPEVMAASGKVAAGVERGCADAVEAAALEDRVGEVFDAMVVEQREPTEALVQVPDPAVLARAHGHSELGTWVKVRLVEATVASSTVRFEVIAPA
jgi:exoribonuclease R